MNPALRNYDFGKHWDSVIVPILQTHTVQHHAAIYRAWCKYKRMGLDYHKYSKHSAPALLMTTHSAYVDLLDSIAEEAIEQKNPQAILPTDKKFLRNWRGLSDEDATDFHMEEYMNLLERVRERLGYNYELHPYRLIHYVPFGACHSWNRYFSLCLAKIVFPNEEWVVRSNANVHTTVYCEKLNLIFDPIYWGIEGRLQKYLKGQPYDDKDVTLGGQLAFDASALDYKRKRKDGFIENDDESSEEESVEPEEKVVIRRSKRIRSSKKSATKK